MRSEHPLLKIPETRAARWQLLERLIQEWCGRGIGQSGYTTGDLTACERRLGFELPMALREWYLLVGRRDDVWQRQDSFVSPENLSVEAGVLDLFVENQAVTSWGIREHDLTLDDPPVVMKDENGEWVEQCREVSEFAIQIFFYCSRFTAPNTFFGLADGSCVARIEAEFPALPLPPFLFCGGEFRLFGFEDLVVNVDSTLHVSVAARSSEALENARAIVSRDDFEVFE